MCHRIVFVREIPELTGESEPVRFLAEVVWYDVSESAIYVRDPTCKKGKSRPPLLVRIDISEFRREQVTGFENAVPFQCLEGEYLTILGKTHINRKKEEENENDEKTEMECSQIGVIAKYINVANGTDIGTYTRAVEVRRRYC